MKRIVIVGSTGSGKTTLAFNLASKLGYPITDLDDLNWNPGWVQSNPDAFRTKVNTALSGDEWIVAGNYRSINDVIWPKADTLLWLDFSFARTFNQLAHRSISRIIDKKPACNGNFETLGRLLSKDSIILWLLKSYADNRKAYNEIFESPEKNPNIKNLIRFKNPYQRDSFLAGIK